jgi:hypothetical protein
MHRLQHRPLHRVERGGEHGSHRVGDLETQVGHHQEQRHGAEDHQLGQGRRSLLEERRWGAVQRAQWHGDSPRSARLIRW